MNGPTPCLRCPCTADSRRMAGIASLPTCRILAPLVLVLIAAISGCSVWQGRLDPQFEDQVNRRLQGIEQARLDEQSIRPPQDIESGLASLKEVAKTEKPSTAPASLELPIDMARRSVLENNLDLSVVTIEPDKARTRVSEEEAKFDATIRVGLSYKKQNPPALDGDIVQFTEKKTALDQLIKGYEAGNSLVDTMEQLAEGQTPKADKVGGFDGGIAKLTTIEQSKESITGDVGLTVPLPTGGKMGVSQVFDRQNKLSPFYSDQSTAPMVFSVSQPLLRNAGLDTNLASIRIARLDAKATSAKTKLVAIRLLAAAEKAYWKLYGARKLLEIREQLNELANRNLELVQKRADEGLVAPIEVIRAQAGVALQLEALIVARTNERIQQRDLKRILNLDGVDLNSPTRLDIATPPTLLGYELESDPLVKRALTNRMEMLEIELELAADAIRIDFARNQTLPLISLDFEYGLVDTGGTPGTAWQSAWDFDNPSFGIGIKGEIPVTNEARKAQLRRAMLNRTQRLSTRAARELAIRQEVLDALDLLEQNWQRILAARQAAVVSGLNYEAERKQFDQGTRTMREVFEALAQLGDAQAREVGAIVAYQVSLVDLAFATGTLLGYSKVDLLDAEF